MKLEIEWRIPWPATWDLEKKLKASEKLAEYMNKGTFFESRRRMRASNVQIVKPAINGGEDPYITLELEN